MGTAAINTEVEAKLEEVRSALAREIKGKAGVPTDRSSSKGWKGDVCVTCSFQAEDMLLTKLALELDPKIPVLFLDTDITSPRRMSIATGWRASGT